MSPEAHEAKKAYDRRYYATVKISRINALKSKGICTVCKKEPAIKGEHRCGACRIKMAESHRRWYLANREKKIAKIRKRKDKLISEGRCQECGISLSLFYTATTRCPNCSDPAMSKRR